MVISYRFDHLGELSDLEGAISRHRDAVDLTSNASGHPNEPGVLDIFGNCFGARFDRLGELPSDLEDALSRGTVGLLTSPLVVPPTNLLVLAGSAAPFSSDSS